jgi:hypothetical protein
MIKFWINTLNEKFYTPRISLDTQFLGGLNLILLAHQNEHSSSKLNLYHCQNTLYKVAAHVLLAKRLRDKFTFDHL